MGTKGIGKSYRLVALVGLLLKEVRVFVCELLFLCFV
jgi:hypothetical protein